jgi:stage V sporulation protein AA
MSEILYLQINRNIEVDKREITIGDVASLHCKNGTITAKVKTIRLVNIPDVPKKRICFSVMVVIQLINQMYPDVEVNNIGESDFIVDYIYQKKKNTRVQKVLQYMMIAFAALLTFMGSAYGIMAYNNDVNTNEIFEKVYEFLGAENIQQYKLIEVMYAIGLALGIIIFYNHFANRKLTSDPTPVEVEMSKYEKDIDEALIDRSTKDGRERSV